MKHKKELSLSIACFLLSFLCFMAWNQERDENLAAKICPAVLRLHVIGASNSDQDQQVKLQVKSFVVKQISSWNASSKDELVLEVQNRQTSLADAIRSYANTGDEDDRDLSRVGMSLEMFRAYTEGYLSQRAGQLNQAEIDHLAFSARYITFEQVLRFLMDYIDGDTYYKTKYPEHNLVRTRAQYKLLQSMEEQYGTMCEIVRETVAKYK